MNEDQSLLPLSKQAISVLALAKRILRMQPGQQIEPIGTWADQLEVGRGTVQAALRLLQDAGAIRVRSRGRYGTIMEQIDYLRLWTVCGGHAVVGTMPLPYTLRYQGLATGLYRAFEAVGLPLQLAYMRGGDLRLDGLSGHRYEFAVLSLRAARTLLEARTELEIAFRFGPDTYTGGHVLLFADPAGKSLKPGMRVGIDPNSHDQRNITELVGRTWDITLVPVHYTQLLPMLTRKDLDAAVWNGDEIAERDVPIGTVRLEELGIDLARANTEAVLVLRRDGLLRSFLEMTFRAATVTQTQQAVLDGREVPQF